MGTQYIFSNVIIFDFYLGGGIQYSKESREIEIQEIMEVLDSDFTLSNTQKIGFNVGVKL